MTYLRHMLRHRPERIFHATVAFLVLSCVLVIAIDVFDIFGLHSRWSAIDEHQYFWIYWFYTPVEVPMQWLCLSGVVLVFFLSAGAAYQSREIETFDFCMLFAISAILMLVEDTLNARHHLRYTLTSEEHSGYSVLGTFSDLAFFGLLGGLLLVVFFRFRHLFWEKDKVRRYLIRGYAFYAIAVTSSWMGPAFRAVSDDFTDAYTAVGGFFIRLLFFDDGERQEHYETIDNAIEPGTPGIEYYFMDRVWEESFELLGAAALLVAALAFFNSLTATSTECKEDH